MKFLAITTGPPYIANSLQQLQITPPAYCVSSQMSCQTRWVIDKFGFQSRHRQRYISSLQHSQRVHSVSCPKRRRGSFLRDKTAEAWSWQIIFIHCQGQEYFHFSKRFLLLYSIRRMDSYIFKSGLLFKNDIKLGWQHQVHEFSWLKAPQAFYCDQCAKRASGWTGSQASTVEGEAGEVLCRCAAIQPDPEVFFLSHWSYPGYLACRSTTSCPRFLFSRPPNSKEQLVTIWADQNSITALK